jgi:hypothetical protein
LIIFLNQGDFAKIRREILRKIKSLPRRLRGSQQLIRERMNWPDLDETWGLEAKTGEFIEKSYHRKSIVSNPAPLYYLPGYHFGYTIVGIDDHPWNTLITMKEILRLEPGSLVFVGPSAEQHQLWWQQEKPELFVAGKKPVFTIDTKIIHPHQVESEPRRPFVPWKQS